MDANTQFLSEFNSLSHFLMNFALKLTREKNKADDLFQDTAYKAFKNIASFTQDSNMKAWLCTIMRNTFINGVRGNKRKMEQEISNQTHNDYLINQFGTDLNQGELKLIGDDLRELINELGEQHRIPLQLLLDGYKYQEIREILNLPIGTIKSRIYHARKIIQKKYATLHKLSA